MKKNERIVLKGEKVLLIPYNKNHVLKYHEWMKSPELQELTASEPLTLDEEYKMQQTWREDDDKCTFIVLDAATFKQNGNEIEAMIGDTNLFYVNSEDGRVAEIEVMIAELSHRCKGLGKEALLLMMAYGVAELNRQKFIAKVKIKNTISRKLFEKLGFVEVGRSEIFDEVTLVKTVTTKWQDFLKSHQLQLIIEEYNSTFP